MVCFSPWKNIITRNVPPLSRYLRFIFDESSILNYCLKVHCTKGQVRNTLPGWETGSGAEKRPLGD
jgi:hypothetical protein